MQIGDGEQIVRALAERPSHALPDPAQPHATLARLTLEQQISNRRAYRGQAMGAGPFASSTSGMRPTGLGDGGESSRWLSRAATNSSSLPPTQDGQGRRAPGGARA